MVTVYIPGWVKRRMDLASVWDIAMRYGQGPTQDMKAQAGHRDAYPDRSSISVEQYLLLAERCGAWG